MINVKTICIQREWTKLEIELVFCIPFTINNFEDKACAVNGFAVVNRFSLVGVKQNMADWFSFNPFVLPNLEPKCAPGDPILYPESIFCHSP